MAFAPKRAKPLSMGIAASSALRDETAADGLAYGSLEGLGGPRKLKKKPVLVLAPEELERAHAMFHDASAELLGEDAERAPRPAPILGLAPMEDDDPEDLGLADDAEPEADDDLPSPEAVLALTRRKSAPTLDETYAEVEPDAEQVFGTIDDVMSDPVGHETIDDGLDLNNRIFPSLPIQPDASEPAQEPIEAAEAAAPPIAEPLPEAQSEAEPLHAASSPAPDIKAEPSPDPVAESVAPLAPLPPIEVEPEAVPIPEPQPVQRAAPVAPRAVEDDPQPESSITRAFKADDDFSFTPAPPSSPKPRVSEAVEEPTPVEPNTEPKLVEQAAPEATEPEVAEPEATEPTTPISPPAESSAPEQTAQGPRPARFDELNPEKDYQTPDDVFDLDGWLAEPQEEAVASDAASDLPISAPEPEVTAAPSETELPVAEDTTIGEAAATDYTLTDDDSVDGYAFMRGTSARRSPVLAAAEGRQSALRAKLIREAEAEQAIQDHREANPAKSLFLSMWQWLVAVFTPKR